jgi:hypothetical protein
LINDGDWPAPDRATHPQHSGLAPAGQDLSGARLEQFVGVVGGQPTAPARALPSLPTVLLPSGDPLQPPLAGADVERALTIGIGEEPPWFRPRLLANAIAGAEDLWSCAASSLLWTLSE